jgi:hypothetical protein
LPSVNAEKSNLQFLITSILKLQELSASQQQILSDVSVFVTQINQRLNSDPAHLPSLGTPASATFGVASPGFHTSLAGTPQTAETLRVTPDFDLDVTRDVTSSGTGNSGGSEGNNNNSGARCNGSSSGGSSSGGSSASNSASSGGSASSSSASNSKKQKLDSTATIFKPAKQIKSNDTAQQHNPLATPLPDVAQSLFASKAHELQTKTKKWTLVQARKNKNIVPVIGKDSSSTLEGVSPSSKDYWEI